MSKEKDINIEETTENPIQENNPENSDSPENTENSENTDEKDPLEAAQEENEKLRDQLLRTVAEFENYKKRTLKEKTELILNGGEKTITAVLPVLDDFERAIADKNEDAAAIKEGMELIFHKFKKTNIWYNIKQFPPMLCTLHCIHTCNNFISYFIFNFFITFMVKSFCIIKILL